MLDLRLAASIAGVVVDAEGTPFSGVNVLFFHENASGYDVTADDGTFRVTALAGGGDYAAQVSTSAERSALYLPPPGQAFPVVHVPDGTSQVTGVRIVIARGRLTISGRVVRDGEPVAGVDVLALSGRGSARAHRGPDGAFVLNELVAGRYELLALRRDGGHASRRGIVVEAGAKDVRLELPSTGSIEGTLRGFRDAPELAARFARGPVGAVLAPLLQARERPVAHREFKARSRMGAKWGPTAIRASRDPAQLLAWLARTAAYVVLTGELALDRGS